MLYGVTSSLSAYKVLPLSYACANLMTNKSRFNLQVALVAISLLTLKTHATGKTIVMFMF